MVCGQAQNLLQAGFHSENQGGGGSGALEKHDFSLIKGMDILPLLGGVNLIASSMTGLHLVHIQVSARWS